MLVDRASFCPEKGGIIFLRNIGTPLCVLIFRIPECIKLYKQFRNTGVLNIVSPRYVLGKYYIIENYEQ
jgi:hypothetical protein